MANLANEKFFLRLIASGKLKVTKSGRAYNLVTGREIGVASRRHRRGGYRKLSWQNPRTLKIVQIQLHRLVWCIYKGTPHNSDLVVNHKDGDRCNCALSNLELVTTADNNRHAWDTGLIPKDVAKGENNSQAKFSNLEVKKFRRLHRKGLISIRQIARRHRVSTGTVYSMLRCTTYKHVK